MKILTVPLVAGLVVPLLAALLLAIGARSPYTHSNLEPALPPGYTRTQLGLVGQVTGLGDSGLLPAARSADPAGRGAALFVTHGCASCHGLRGQGSAVGPAIAGTDARTLRAKTQKGPGGMPTFSPKDLTDDDLAAIAAYLQAQAPAR